MLDLRRFRCRNRHVDSSPVRLEGVAGQQKNQPIKAWGGQTMKNIGYVVVAAAIALPLAFAVDKAGIDDAANKGADTTAQKAHELKMKSDAYQAKHREK